MRRALLMVGCFVLAGAPLMADTGDDIIAIVKAQWAAGKQKNVAEESKNIADDYTEFNLAAATRIEGKALASRLAEAGYKDAAVELASEMLSPKVQVYGDTAILSYNYYGLLQGKDGKVEPSRAKSTRVYVKQGGKWMLVHANFAADPLPKQ